MVIRKQCNEEMDNNGGYGIMSLRKDLKKHLEENETWTVYDEEMDGIMKVIEKHLKRLVK